MTVSEKARLVEQLVERLAAERDVVAAAQRSTQAGATHEENRAEGDKDMRATEASYLARGQAERVVTLESDLARLRALALRDFSATDAIEAGAIVTLVGASRRSKVFLLPAGAGEELVLGELRVRVVTPGAPLGAALLGARQGDEVEVERGGESQVWEVLRVT